MAFERAPELVPRIAAIGEHMAQPGEAIADSFEDIDGPVAVLNIGGMDQDEDQLATSVSNDMPFAAFDLLACVIAANSSTFRGFDALAVDDTATGRGFATLDFAQVHNQHHVDRIKQTRITPGVEIAPHSRHRRKAFWQHPPRTTARRNIEQRVHNFAHIGRARPPPALGGRDKRCCQ
jgi:hypothetical protein